MPKEAQFRYSDSNKQNRVVSELPVRHLVDLGELKVEQDGRRMTAKNN